MKFCTQCGGDLALKIPPDDNRKRHVCGQCDHIHYRNPTIITGCLPIHDDQVLLCKRAIEPRHGFWTLPAGFLENGETIADGAMRETHEEACARVDLQGLYGVIDLPHIHQVYMFYRASLKDINFGPGSESLETRLFKEEEIPWDNLAFAVIDLMLGHYFEQRKTGKFSLLTTQLSSSRPNR